MRILLTVLLLVGSAAAQALSCTALQHRTVLRCAGQHAACSAEFLVLDQRDRGCRGALSLHPVEPAHAEFMVRFAALAGLPAEPGLYLLSVPHDYWQPMAPTTQAFMELLRFTLELQSSAVTPEDLLARLERKNGLDWEPVLRGSAPRLHRLGQEPTKQGLAALRSEFEDRARAARRAAWLEDGLSGAGALMALLLWVHGAESFFRRLHCAEPDIGRALLVQAAAAGLVLLSQYLAPPGPVQGLLTLLLIGMAAALAPQFWALLRRRWRPVAPQD
ncbi:hypothetical protein [Inhella sp.]|uniref:hypothetical protein n=1 Tax=Inhella sp. TaxID=1921806 RepID=UPI0035B289E7